MAIGGGHGDPTSGSPRPYSALAEIERIGERLRGVDDPLFLLQAVFAHVPYAAAVVDARGKMLVTNRAFTELFGTEPPPG